VYVDAKKAALDIRVVDPLARGHEQDKVHRVANNILKHYERWQEDNGTQLVFCDLSTPSKSAKSEATVLIKWVAEQVRAEESVLKVLHDQPFEVQWSELKKMALAELDDEIVDDKRREVLEAMILSVDGDAGVFITADTGFSVYDSLRTLLIERGVPAAEVQFIHDYPKASDKKDLFDQVNAGQVRVLIGSTSKMGAGTNVQERLVALHHIDPSMYNRPSDIEQREGRIVRQGNTLYERDPENFEVEIIAYSTERSFDAVSWQLLTRKQEMLEGFRNGCRSIEEDHNDSASYMEFMAETTGNPIFREKIQLETEITELETNARRIRAKLSSSKHRIENEAIKNSYFDRKIANIEAARAAALMFDDINYKNTGYKKDYKSVFSVEYDAYLKEKSLHAQQLADYAKDYGQWKAKDKAARGVRPVKPSSPDNPSHLDSPRMLEKSEQAQFLKEIMGDIAQGRSPTFYVGRLGYTVSLCPKDKDPRAVYEIHDYYKLIDYTPFNRIHPHQLVSEILERENTTILDRLLEQEQRYYKFHKDQCLAAHRIVDSFKDDQKELLEDKQTRHKAIVAVVSEIEDLERDRRLGQGNAYILSDAKRFRDLKETSERHSEDDFFSMAMA